MKNPNAVAAFVSSQAGVAVEQLVQQYANAGLGSFWGKEAVAAFTIATLYVGRNGLKAAFGKAWSALKGIWVPAPAK